MSWARAPDMLTSRPENVDMNAANAPALVIPLRTWPQSGLSQDRRQADHDGVGRVAGVERGHGVAARASPRPAGRRRSDPSITITQSVVRLAARPSGLV